MRLEDGTENDCFFNSMQYFFPNVDILIGNRKITLCSSDLFMASCMLHPQMTWTTVRQVCQNLHHICYKHMKHPKKAIPQESS